jgi:hypothetical protein
LAQKEGFEDLKTHSKSLIALRYSFYPKSEYFTGFNLGHYFSNEISAKTDYFERLSEMGNRLKSEISKTCCETDEDMEI